MTRDVLVGGTNVLYASKTVDGVETAVNSRKNLDKTAKITLEICLRASAQLKAMNAAPHRRQLCGHCASLCGL